MVPKGSGSASVPRMITRLGERKGLIRRLQSGHEIVAHLVAHLRRTWPLVFMGLAEHVLKAVEQLLELSIRRHGASPRWMRLVVRITCDQHAGDSISMPHRREIHAWYTRASWVRRRRHQLRTEPFCR